jgi:membrane protease YdiL (CAAX protease family)
MTDQADMKVLGGWETLGWAVLAFAIAQVVGTAVVYFGFPDQMPSATVLEYGGKLLALVTLITNPVQIAFLAAIVRWRTRAGAARYLGLVGFSLRDFLVGFLAIAVLAAAIDGVTWLAGLEIVSPFQSEAYTSARADGWVVALTLAIVVVGPVGEEIMFRGFLFRGWVTPGIGGVTAIVLITMLWAMMHVQYDWFGIGQVFLTGLVLGWIRWRSGSTLLTIVLHMLVNLESTIETMAKIGWTGS